MSTWAILLAQAIEVPVVWLAPGTTLVFEPSALVLYTDLGIRSEWAASRDDFEHNLLTPLRGSIQPRGEAPDRIVKVGVFAAGP